ncbi:MAG: M23 family metallopeptidase [Pseudomonadota bacterium]
MTRGDTLNTLAAQLDIATPWLARANNLPPPYIIHLGQELTIPTGAPPYDDQAQNQPRKILYPSDALANTELIAIMSPPPARRDFLLPVRGNVIETQQTDHRIWAVGRSAPVRAAKTGVVLFNQAQVGDFGRVVALYHEGGFMTVYGHLRASLVKPGDIVSRGQIIARAGQSGKADDPRLYFEALKDGVRLDQRGLFSP